MTSKATASATAAGGGAAASETEQQQQQQNENETEQQSSSPASTTTCDRYPRTVHFSFSPGVNPDDIVESASTNSASPFVAAGTEVHISEKLDGGNCCYKQGVIYARTHSHAATHDSFSAVKAFFHNVILPQLSDDEYERWEFFGENMCAVHSIRYDDADHPLPAPFFLFAVRDNVADEFLSVDRVAEIAENLGFAQPPVLWRGIVGGEGGGNHNNNQQQNKQSVAKIIQDAMREPSLLGRAMGTPGPVPVEGFVARVAGAFPTRDFERCVHKCVRANHIQTDDDSFRTHWVRAHFL